MKRGTLIFVLLTAILLAGCEKGGEQQESEGDVLISTESVDTDSEDSYWYPRGERIDGQCFDLSMEPIGKVSFASHWPGEAAGENGDAVFLVEKNGVVWQQLEGITENNIRENLVLVRVEAVSFADSNRDGYDDILLICSYNETGKSDEVYEVRYYQGSETGSFTLDREISGRMTEELKTPTVAAARSYLKEEFGFSEETVAVVESIVDSDTQLKLLAENVKFWGQAIYTTYSYAVTDLDQNGRLEVLVACQQGTGLYTYLRCFEVNAKGKGVDEMTMGFLGIDSGPDVIQNNAVVYYDRADSVYRYLFDDILRISPKESVITQIIVSKEEEVLTAEPIAFIEISASTDAESYTYFSAEGEEITLEEYEGYVDNRYADLEKKTARFNWISVEAGELEEYTFDELYQRLETSWEGFDIYSRVQ